MSTINIVDVKIETIRKLSEIYLGQCFRFKEIKNKKDLFIKVKGSGNTDVHVYNFDKKELCSYDRNIKVVCIEADLVIK